VLTEKDTHYSNIGALQTMRRRVVSLYEKLRGSRKTTPTLDSLQCTPDEKDSNEFNLGVLKSKQQSDADARVITARTTQTTSTPKQSTPSTHAPMNSTLC